MGFKDKDRREHDNCDDKQRPVVTKQDVFQDILDTLKIIATNTAPVLGAAPAVVSVEAAVAAMPKTQLLLEITPKEDPIIETTQTAAAPIVEVSNASANTI